ncbi:unnamed protein product, partial [Protopolystoma xenopodis]
FPLLFILLLLFLINIIFLFLLLLFLFLLFLLLFIFCRLLLPFLLRLPPIHGAASDAKEANSPPRLIGVGLPEARSLNEGDRLELYCRMTGDPKPTTCWIKDGMWRLESNGSDLEVSHSEAISTDHHR